MNGKAKCKILKEIRRRIAAENEIPFVTKDCTYQGSCKGTCPKCEEELRYLERQLEKRQRLGKAVAVSALSLSLLAGSVACEPLFEERVGKELEGDVPYSADTTEEMPSPETGIPGALPEVPTTEDLVEFEGEPLPEDTEEPVLLEGDVAYIEPEESEELLLGMLPYTGEDSTETEGDE